MPSAEHAPIAQAATRMRSFVGVVSMVAIALLIVALVPKIRAWRAREARVTAAQAQLQDLANIVRNQAMLDALIQQHEGELALRPQRVLRSRSRALATSALQSLVQEMAEASNVTVTRLDVANSVNSGDLPITLSANGDIFGLAELLRQLRSARYTVVVDKLQVQNNSALRGAPDVLQVALSLHAPVIVQ